MSLIKLAPEEFTRVIGKAIKMLKEMLPRTKPGPSRKRLAAQPQPTSSREHTLQLPLHSLHASKVIIGGKSLHIPLTL